MHVGFVQGTLCICITITKTMKINDYLYFKFKKKIELNKIMKTINKQNE